MTGSRSACGPRASPARLPPSQPAAPESGRCGSPGSPPRSYVLPCRLTPLGRGYSQPVARRDVPAGERALVDLEYAAVGDFRVVERARVGVARLHVEDLQDAPVSRVKGDRERDEGVLHPEGAAVVLGEDECHPGVGREGGPAHEPLLPLCRGIGDLDRDRRLLVPVREDGLRAWLRAVSAAAAGENDDGGGEKRPRRGSLLRG